MLSKNLVANGSLFCRDIFTIAESVEITEIFHAKHAQSAAMTSDIL